METKPLKTAHVDRFSAERLPRLGTWPEFIFDKHVPPYEEYLNAAEALLSNGFENRPAIYMNDLAWTYSELNHKANQIAQILTQDLDLKPGNRVLLRGGNTPILAALCDRKSTRLNSSHDQKSYAVFCLKKKNE